MTSSTTGKRLQPVANFVGRCLTSFTVHSLVDERLAYFEQVVAVPASANDVEEASSEIPTSKK